MNTRKRLCMIVPALLLFTFITGCAKVEKKDVMRAPVKIGVDVFPGWAHVFIAQEKGIFKKNGVEVEIVLNKDYLEVQKSFIDGKVDGAFMVYADSVFTNDQSVPLKVVYISDQSVKGDVFVALPEIANFSDLKADTRRKIAVEGINTFSHLFVLSVLQKNGINEGDVLFENVGAQQLVEALEKGQVAAGHTYGLGKTLAQQKGYKVLAYAGDVQGIITDVLAFNSKVIQERPEDIRKIVRSLFEAKAFQATNREEALQILARAIGDTPESIAEGIDAVQYFNTKENVEAMHPSEALTNLFGSGKLIAQFFIDRGQIATFPDFHEMIDSQFVE